MHFSMLEKTREKAKKKKAIAENQESKIDKRLKKKDIQSLNVQKVDNFETQQATLRDLYAKVNTEERNRGLQINDVSYYIDNLVKNKEPEVLVYVKVQDPYDIMVEVRKKEKERMVAEKKRKDMLEVVRTSEGNQNDALPL